MSAPCAEQFPGKAQHSQAAAYLWAQNSVFPAAFSIRPARSDPFGNLVFSDGSILKKCLISGVWVASQIDILTLLALENTAFAQGRQDRLARQPMDRRFGKEGNTKLYAEKVSYKRGWWSVSEWPKGKFSKNRH